MKYQFQTIPVANVFFMIVLTTTVTIISATVAVDVEMLWWHTRDHTIMTNIIYCQCQQWKDGISSYMYIAAASDIVVVVTISIDVVVVIIDTAVATIIFEWRDKD